jgi:predicted alpha-1,2-mannosidase
MKRIVPLILSLWLAACGEESPPVDDTPPVDLVNTFIGSGGDKWKFGSVFPGASRPFGMAKPGADTTKNRAGDAEEWHHFSGYHYDDEFVTGFSQVHISGTGGADYGALLLMPTVGFDAEKVAATKYRSQFSKENESASPGYYGVRLDDHGIQVDLTASERCAYHRYTYPAGTIDGYVIIDLSHAIVSCDVSAAHADVDAGAGEISGWLQYHGSLTKRSGGFRLYFSAVFNQTLEDWTVWQDGALLNEETTAEGVDVGVAVAVETADPVEVQIGLSYVDVAGARKNRQAELKGKDFETVHAEARQAWVEKLSLVSIKGGTPGERIKFYSALYHAMLHPTLFCDTDGRYTGFDKQVHTAGGFLYYTDFSMWDTYRNVHSLFDLIIPDRQRDMVVSLIKMYEEGGSLPKWPAATGYTGCMIGTPADMVISESYLKGITDFDVETAFAAMKEHATGPVANSGRDGIEYYMDIGYVPADQVGGSVSHTQEFCIADAAIAALAKVLGKTQDAADFTARSLNYKNHWDPSTQFMRGKNQDGSWYEPDEKFTPLDWNADYYTEGDAWQYLWLAPHDPQGLLDLFGSADAMGDKLEEFFATPEPENPEGIFPPRYYWHGNEPDIHAAYLFNEVGRPDRAQHWVRHILETRYHAEAAGIPGNDDLGTMSSWYVFSSSGFYPIAGLTHYYIGSPLFEEITFQLGGGRTLVVKAKNADYENKYIQSAKLNGEALDITRFDHQDIKDGGVLELKMGDTPSDWGQ